MIAAIVTIFYIGGILAAIEAVMTARTSQGAVAWSVSLVSFPFVALPAYLVLGRSKFAGMVNAYDERKDEINQIYTEFHNNLRPWAVEADDQPSVYRAIRQLSHMELTHGNRAELLINGDATFGSILEGVAQAQDYVLFQFYMFHDDQLGRQVQAALIERAEAGVRVYVLYDEIGSGGLPDSYVEKLRAAGVQVSSFKPTPKFSPWRDTHVKLEGPVAIQLQATILGDWYWATRQLPELNWQPQAAEGGNVAAMIVPFAPSQKLETAGLFFVSALNSAQHRIWLSAAYFVPDEAIMKALELAALRGVDVRIITTGTPDSWPVYLAAFSYIDKLRDLGIKFYAYQPGFLHEKVMLVDDRFSTVGTPNFDNRSFRLNFEVTALIVDEAFNKEMEAMFEADFAHSVPINADDLEKKPFWWRLAVNLSRLASPVL